MIKIDDFNGTLGSSNSDRQKLADSNGFDVTLLADELLEHSIELDHFYADAAPVTCSQFFGFLEATGYEYPDAWREQFNEANQHKPVVGVSQFDALAYAQWCGKRLPTAEESEAIWRSRQVSLISAPADLFDISKSGEAGQVSEWTSSEQPHHDTTFALAKGYSHLHSMAWQRRPEAAFWMPYMHRLPFVGFRCVSDVPATCPCCEPKESSKVCFPDIGAEDSKPGLYFDSNQRYGRLTFGDEDTMIGLSVPETVDINGEPAISYFNSPTIEAIKSEPNAWHYKMDLGACELGVGMDLNELPQGQHLRLNYAFRNTGKRIVSVVPSSCINWTSGNHPGSNPEFFDVEGERTYLWLEGTGWKRLREYPRLGNCTRWIAEKIRVGDLQGFTGSALLGLVSRDGKRAAGYGRHQLSEGSKISSNMCFTCMHIDPEVALAAGTSEQVAGHVFLMSGGLEDLLKAFSSVRHQV